MKGKLALSLSKGENVLGADNQQERLNENICYKIAGFVDGEGSFHVGIQKSSNVRLGWQIVPEFHVSQNYDRQDALIKIKDIFGCGYIKANHKNNPSDKTSVYVVRNIDDLNEKILPFFERYELFSDKQKEFKKFSFVVQKMKKKEHLSKKGLINILQIAFSMNRNGSYRKMKLEDILIHLESSETICRTQHI